MALFDGGRWDRVRNSRKAGRCERGRWRFGGEVAMYEAPLPRVGVWMEDGTIAVYASMGGAWNDRFLSGEVAVRAPALTRLVRRVWSGGDSLADVPVGGDDGD